MQWIKIYQWQHRQSITLEFAMIQCCEHWMYFVTGRFIKIPMGNHVTSLNYIYGGSLHQKLLYCWWCVKNTFDEVFQSCGNCPFSDVMKPGKHCESQAKLIFRIFKLEKPQKCTTSPAIWRLHIKKEWK